MKKVFSENFTKNFSFQTATIVSRFASQFCKSRPFAFAVAKLAYNELPIDQVVDSNRDFVLKMDKMLSNFSAHESEITPEKLRSKMTLLEGQFISFLNGYNPAYLGERIKRHCNFDIKLDLQILNQIESIITVNDWSSQSSKFLQDFANNGGRELPLLNIENQLHVRT